MISLKIYFYYSCWPLKLKKKTEVLSFDLNNKCCYIIKASTAQNILPRFYRDNILASRLFIMDSESHGIGRFMGHFDDKSDNGAIGRLTTAIQ